MCRLLLSSVFYFGACVEPLTALEAIEGTIPAQQDYCDELEARLLSGAQAFEC